MNIDSFLKSSHLCSELSEEELAELIRIAEPQRLKRKQILFFEGEPASGFFILLKGKVRVYKASPEGKEYTLHLIQPGQMFAEAALFRGKGYPANCAALEDSVVACFPKDRFLKLIEHSPRISLKMISALSSFVREFNQQVEDLTLREVPARLAAYLLREHGKHSGAPFALDISKNELASKLGTISETLSRSLRKLKDSGSIEVKGKFITILDGNRLQSIADGEKI